ncbi:hypothetical protein X884_5607 [Burkholderia pseudomallei MSHR4308]|nr:hypothetical protein X884_5607 [Burkholderia pseudomallei MSHR4308]
MRRACRRFADTRAMSVPANWVCSGIAVRRDERAPLSWDQERASVQQFANSPTSS